MVVSVFDRSPGGRTIVTGSYPACFSDSIVGLR